MHALFTFKITVQKPVHSFIPNLFMQKPVHRNKRLAFTNKIIDVMAWVRSNDLLWKITPNMS